MFKLSDPANFRRSITGLGMILGPLLIFVADLIEPETSDDDVEYVRDVADATGRVEVSTVMWMFGFFFLAVGVIGVVHMIRSRGVTLAHIGGSLAFMGAFFFGALVTTGFFDVILAESLTAEQAAEVIEEGEDLGSVTAVFILAAAGVFFGVILLAVALIREGRVPIWVPIVLILGVIVLIPFSPAGNALLLVGFGYLGLRTLGTPDAEWEAPGSPSAQLGGAEAVPPAQPPDTPAPSTPPGPPPPPA